MMDRSSNALDHALDLPQRQVEILEYLWGILSRRPSEHCEDTSTTRIYEALSVLDGDEAKVAGTVLTQLSRMCEKGLLEEGEAAVELRDKEGNLTSKFRLRKSYIPTVSRDEVRRVALVQFQRRFYDGSPSQLKKDLEEIL